MTIRDFSLLCGCNPQTLRYYDRVNLLKPSFVDSFSGYRFYEKDQAFTFVKIKNLQKAGFTIEEIKALLDQDDLAVYDALDHKIREAEGKLQEIKAIRQSYHTEMSEIRQKIAAVTETITRSMEQYDPAGEFGITPAQYSEIIANVTRSLSDSCASLPSDAEYTSFSDEDMPDSKPDYASPLDNPAFTTVYENHNWQHVKDFFHGISVLEDSGEYVLVFRVDCSKGTYNEDFGNTVLGLLLSRNLDKRKSLALTCNTEASTDGRNHFWLLKRL